MEIVRSVEYILSNGDRIPVNSVIGDSIKEATHHTFNLLDLLVDIDTKALKTSLEQALDAQAIVWSRA